MRAPLSWIREFTPAEASTDELVAALNQVGLEVEGADELGLGDDHEGIVHLDGSTKPGRDVRELLGLDDVVFDLSITPNRPDAMCIVGVARELAAHFGLPLQVPEADAPTDSAVRSDITVRVDAPDRCPRYLGRMAQVTMGPSPSWMAQRLVKAGMPPISHVVAVT